MNDFADNDAEPRQIKQFDAAFYQAMIDTLHEGAFVVEKRCFKLVNEAFCHLTGCKKKDLIGQPFDSFIYPQDVPLTFEDPSDESSITRLKTPTLKKQMDSKHPEYHLVVTHISGSHTPIEISSQHFIDAKGRLFQIANVRKKLVEQVLNQAVKESEKELQQLVENLPSIYFRTDSSGNITRMSNHTASLLGFSIADLIDTSLSELYISPEEQAHTLAKIVQSNGETTELEVSFRCKDLSTLTVNVSGSAKYNKHQEFLGIEIIAQQQPAKSLASAKENYDIIRDPLTKLINHIGFSEHLSKSVRSARRHQSQLWVLYVSLQNLTDIENKFGSQVSESCLVHFSQRLQSFFRDTDIVARIGEDNFAVLLDDYTSDLALDDLINRLQEVMDKKAAISQYPYGFTFNIGTANFPQDGINSTDLMNHAESMMYKYKFSRSNLPN